MQKINYQKLMENEIAHNRQEQKVPALLLHSCCAPCSSYCLETLSEDFAITVFYSVFCLRNIKSLFSKATMKKNGFMRQ